uniref:Uncharacterized protein n=1 Tax=Oryza barthii TaxID=65489 RepID=A0A0D3FXJ9_9ORYZ
MNKKYLESGDSKSTGRCLVVGYIGRLRRPRGPPDLAVGGDIELNDLHRRQADPAVSSASSSFANDLHFCDLGGGCSFIPCVIVGSVASSSGARLLFKNFRHREINKWQQEYVYNSTCIQVYRHSRRKLYNMYRSACIPT